MKRIPLTQGKFAIVDDEDFEYLSQFKWCASKNGNRYYAKRSIWENGRRFLLPMQNAIMGVPHGVIVDHIDQNGLNNTRHNLRVCTRAENNYNKGKQKNNTSGFKGVSRDRRKWCAVIWMNRTRKHLGFFSTPEEAARAYDAAARELHGDFACTNFVD